MGLSVARQLAAKGANVIIIARSQQKLDAALAEIKVSDDRAPWCAHRQLTIFIPDARPLPNPNPNASTPSLRMCLNQAMLLASSPRPRLGTMASPQTSCGASRAWQRPCSSTRRVP